MIDLMAADVEKGTLALSRAETRPSPPSLAF